MPGAHDKQIRQLTRDEQMRIVDIMREGGTAADSWRRINATRKRNDIAEVHKTTVHRYASGQTQARCRRRSWSEIEPSAPSLDQA